MSVLGTNLDKINEQLTGITDYIDGYVSNFDGKTQPYVDAQMDILETEVSGKLNSVKNIKIVPPLHNQYENSLATIEHFQPLIDFILALTELTIDPESIVTAVNTIKDGLIDTLGIITAPYQPAIDFGLEIVPKVAELGENLVEVATYQPPAVEGVTIPPLDIDIILTMDDIITG